MVIREVPTCRASAVFDLPPDALQLVWLAPQHGECLVDRIHLDEIAVPADQLHDPGTARNCWISQ